MLYNINPISLHCVFHGIRFKVNKDWLSGIDSLLFLYPLHLFFHTQISSFLRIYAIFIPFFQITYPPIQRKYYICKVYECEEKHKLKKS